MLLFFPVSLSIVVIMFHMALIKGALLLEIMSHIILFIVDVLVKPMDLQQQLLDHFLQQNIVMEFVNYLKSIPSLTFNQLCKQQDQKTHLQQAKYPHRSSLKPRHHDLLGIVSPFGKKYPLKHHHPHNQEDTQCAACLFLKAQEKEREKKQFLKKKQPITFQHFYTSRRKKAPRKSRHTDRPHHQSGKQNTCKNEEGEDDLNILSKKIASIPPKIKNYFQKVCGVSCENIGFLVYTTKFLQRKGRNKVKKTNIIRLLENPEFQEQVRIDFKEPQIIPLQKKNSNNIQLIREISKIEPQKDIVQSIYNQIIQKSANGEALFCESNIDQLAKMKQSEISGALTSLQRLLKVQFTQKPSEEEYIEKKVLKLGKQLVSKMKKQEDNGKQKIVKVLQFVQAFTKPKSKKDQYITFKDLDSSFSVQSDDSQQMFSKYLSKKSRGVISQKSDRSLRTFKKIKHGQDNLSLSQQSLLQNQPSLGNMRIDQNQNNLLEVNNVIQEHSSRHSSSRLSRNIISDRSNQQSSDQINDIAKEQEQFNGLIFPNVLSHGRQEGRSSFLKRDHLSSIRKKTGEEEEYFEIIEKDLRPKEKKKTQKTPTAAEIKANEHAKTHQKFFRVIQRTFKGSKFEGMLIRRNDCVLTKKKKIRLLREICRKKGSIDMDSMLLDDLFRYLDLYEQNCQLMLNSGQLINMKEAKPSDFRSSNIFEKRLISPELMFMDLNENYIYGQAEEAEIDFQALSKNRYNAFLDCNMKGIQTRTKRFEFPKISITNSTNELYKKKREDELVQIGLPAEAQLQIIPMKRDYQIKPPQTLREIKPPSKHRYARSTAAIQKLTTLIAARREKRLTMRQNDEQKNTRVMLTQDSKNVSLLG